MQAPAMRTLHTHCCTLLPQLACHADEMFEVLGDPAIYEFENAPPASVELLALRYARLESRAAPDGSELWLNWVVQLPDRRLAGFVQATVMPSGAALVAYELASRHWRKGIGSAAVLAMLAELASAYQVHTALAVLKAHNLRSAGLLHKLGFVPGSPAEAAGIDPIGSDEILMHRPCALKRV